jgi:hypothetical protein
VFDGATRALQKQLGERFVRGFAVGDVNGDGKAEIVAGLEVQTGVAGRVLNAMTGATLAEISGPGFEGAVVRDIDSTPGAEIVAGGNRIAAYRYNGTAALTTVFSLPIVDLIVSAPAIANVDASDARLELVVTRSDGAILVADVPTSGPRIEWNSAALGPQTPRSLSGPFYGGDLIHGVGHAPAPLFMNKRTGIGLDGGTRLFTMDPSSGALTYSAEIPQSHEFFDAGDVVPIDYNGDGTEEVFYGAADFADVFQGAYNFYGNQQIYRSTATSGIGPTVDIAQGDLNGDGAKDLVALTSAGYLRAWSVSSGQQLLNEYTSGGTAVEVANIDGAGGPEIIVLADRGSPSTRAAPARLRRLSLPPSIGTLRFRFRSARGRSTATPQPISSSHTVAMCRGSIARSNRRRRSRWGSTSSRWPSSSRHSRGRILSWLSRGRSDLRSARSIPRAATRSGAHRLRTAW